MVSANNESAKHFKKVFGKKYGRYGQFKRQVEARGAVVRFLRANPFSTEVEIYKACGVNISSVFKKGFFKNRTVDGVRQWRVVANPVELT